MGAGLRLAKDSVLLLGQDPLQLVLAGLDWILILELHVVFTHLCSVLLLLLEHDTQVLDAVIDASSFHVAPYNLHSALLFQVLLLDQVDVVVVLLRLSMAVEDG